MCRICADYDEGTGAPTTPAAAPSDAQEAVLEAGRAFLTKYATVDIHAHPGRFFMAGQGQSAPLAALHEPPDIAGALADMHAGGVGCVLFATVADHVILNRSPGGLRAMRPYAPGEAYEDQLRQLRILDDLTADASAQIDQLRMAPEINATHRAGRLGCIYSIEGGDFIEDRLERVDEAHARGVRLITLIHYATNLIGDPQTEAPVHGGLSPFGRDVVRAMNRAGILIDLAHGSEAATRQAVEASAHPLIISHSNVAIGDADHPRLISLDHARMVTREGGLIGAVAAGFGQHDFAGYVQTIMRMIDHLGIDHVAIGTDMDFTYRSVMPSYRDWPLLAGALLQAGLGDAELALLMGGNFMRLLNLTNPE